MTNHRSPHDNLGPMSPQRCIYKQIEITIDISTQVFLHPQIERLFSDYSPNTAEAQVFRTGQLQAHIRYVDAAARFHRCFCRWLPAFAWICCKKKSRKNTFEINDERHFGIFSQPPISDEGKKQRYSKFLFSSQFCLCLLDARNMRESEREIDER